MKKICLLSMLTSVAMMFACQKKDSAAQQQLTQPTTDLSVREDALAEKLNSLEKKVNLLDQRVKELTEKENAAANIRTSSTNVQSRPFDPAQVQAERDRLIQQLATMIPHPSQAAAGDPAKQERSAPRQLGPEDLQRQWQSKLNNPKMSGEAVFPAAEAASPIPSPTPE
jgi:hypothetical protein